MFSKKSISRIFSVLFVIAFIISVTPPQTAHAASIRYATPVGTGDCSSWPNACSLQTALTGAANGDEIWVMTGTYKPATDQSDRVATFQLVENVAIYGGFAGSETFRSQRDPVAHITVLSGDIDNNDSQTPVITDVATVLGNTTNSYHVVSGANGAILDGFTITAGNANDGNFPNDRGGGMYNTVISLTLTNVIFSGNHASLGGGMFNDVSNITLTSVTFIANSADVGGGMKNDCYGSPTCSTLTLVTFNSNTATTKGGGMSNDSSSPILTNVTFRDNKTAIGGYGGGMYNDYSSSPTLTNVTFSGNYASKGAGMSNNSSSPTLTNVTFSGNSGGYGVGMYNDSSNPTLINVTLFSNTGVGGAGMMNSNGSNPTLTNVTFYLNSAWFGGGIQNTDSSPHIRNSIIWANFASAISPAGTAQIGNSGSSIASLSDSVIQDGCPTGTNCTNYITANPNLDWIGDFGGFTQTIPLLAGSSAIDTGNDGFCPVTDQRGITRPQGAHCDIGAFEVKVYSIYLPLILR